MPAGAPVRRVRGGGAGGAARRRGAGAAGSARRGGGPGARHGRCACAALRRGGIWDCDMSMRPSARCAVLCCAVRLQRSKRAAALLAVVLQASSLRTPRRGETLTTARCAKASSSKPKATLVVVQAYMLLTSKPAFIATHSICKPRRRGCTRAPAGRAVTAWRARAAGAWCGGGAGDAARPHRRAGPGGGGRRQALPGETQHRGRRAGGPLTRMAMMQRGIFDDWHAHARTHGRRCTVRYVLHAARNDARRPAWQHTAAWLRLGLGLCGCGRAGGGGRRVHCEGAAGARPAHPPRHAHPAQQGASACRSGACAHAHACMHGSPANESACQQRLRQPCTLHA